MSEFKLGDRVRLKNPRYKEGGWVTGEVIGHDPFSSALQVRVDDGQWWYIHVENLYPDDGSELPVIAPKGHVHIGWMQEIVYVDGPCRSYFDGEANKPSSYKEWKHSDLLDQIVLSERIFPVFAAE